MTRHISRLAFTALTVAAVLCTAGPTAAQVAGGTTTVEASVTESTRLAMGWSAKKTLMGKTVYNEAGVKVGKVEDLIISPDKKVSSVIVGAAAADAKAKIDIDIDIIALQSDVKSAETKLSDMKQAGVVRWREFEADVSAATARLRKSTEKATG